LQSTLIEREEFVIVRNFEYLLALSKERHFARAAAACGVSQPTLSSGIKQLEEDMDVLIVNRGQRFEGFTPEGERVLAWAQQMLEDCMRLRQELHELRDQGLQGSFRLGMLQATSALASMLSVAFGERFPALQISVETADAAELLRAVRQGEIDVALTWIEDPVGEGLDSFTLYRERLFLFTTNDAVATGERRISWAEVAKLPLCLLRSAVTHTEEIKLQAGAQETRIVYTDSPSVVAAHVLTGKWSTVLPQTLVSLLMRTPGLRAVAIAPPGDQQTVGFATLKCTPLPSTIHALMELAHEPEMVEKIRAMLADHTAYTPRRERRSRATSPRV
jgi:DNA-binding transcriptional LysR family regulator